MASIDIATLTTEEAERLSNGVALTNDGTVSLGGNETIGDLSGAGTITNNGNDLAVTQTSDQTFSGTLSGAGGLTMQGEATLTLSTGSSFTWDANVNDGGLTVSGALATAFPESPHASPSTFCRSGSSAPAICAEIAAAWFSAI